MPRFLLWSVLLAVATLLSTAASSAVAGVTDSVEVADLKKQLEAGLKARRTVEFEFIARVVAKVEAGTLPLLLVKSTFQWARVKKPFPYVYFQRALILRAAKIGITVK